LATQESRDVSHGIYRPGGQHHEHAAGGAWAAQGVHRLDLCAGHRRGACSCSHQSHCAPSHPACPFERQCLTGGAFQPLQVPLAMSLVWHPKGLLSVHRSTPLFGIGFVDYAGGGVLHLVSGAASLVAAFSAGPRLDEKGHARFRCMCVTPTPRQGPSSTHSL
jgi:hypothetical protein